MIWKYCDTNPSTPLVARADRPDRPDLVGAAANRFFDVRVRDVDRVDERVAVDDDAAGTTSAARRRRTAVLGHLRLAECTTSSCLLKL